MRTTTKHNHIPLQIAWKCFPPTLCRARKACSGSAATQQSSDQVRSCPAFTAPQQSYPPTLCKARSTHTIVHMQTHAKPCTSHIVHMQTRRLLSAPNVGSVSKRIHREHEYRGCQTLTALMIAILHERDDLVHALQSTVAG